MANSEYLNYFRQELLHGDVDQMLEENKPLTKKVLLEYLELALENLKTYPGPNLEFRRDNADDWIGWWTRFIKSNNYKKRGILTPFDSIARLLQPDKTSGVGFGGGSEAHKGHRFFVKWILENVHHGILLLERDWYIEAKERGGPYLDLRARISMWVLFHPNIIVSVLPKKPDFVNTNLHYKELFNETGAIYCFASESDPYWEEKVKRGKVAPFLLVPSQFIQHTTDKVKQLDKDEHEETLRRLINTTDNTTKFRSIYITNRGELAALFSELRGNPIDLGEKFQQINKI